LRLIFCTALFLISAVCAGHPVPYKDAVAITTLNQPFQSDSSVAYSFKRNAAVAARIMTFDDGVGQMSFVAPQLNFLIKRWNGEGFQANTYTSLAVGPMTYNGHEHSAILTALDADAESRWLYISGKAEKMWTGEGYDFWHLQGRVGGAPYAAGFNQLATWVMFQYDYNPILRNWTKITPLVRMFYKNVLWEAGYSTDGDWLLNLMVHL
jgi:hypothetical protein